MSLESLGWNSVLQSHFHSWRDGGEPARVFGLDRDRFRLVLAGGEECVGELAGRIRDPSGDASERVAIGDWVVIEPSAHDGPRRIVAALPRSSAIVRQDAGRSTRVQVLAANVDTAFLVAGLDHDFNPRRIERYLATVYEGGVEPVVVLNKADQVDDLPARLDEARAVAPGVEVRAVSAIEPGGLDALAPWLRPGRSVVLLGSSGVGKSTITNALLGEDRQATGAVREWDSRGRHTTTRREMFALPSGAWLVDTPGLRLVRLWADEEALADSFAEITELISGCRFRNCSHDSEPGCAVREAVESGVLAADRLASWRKLQREMRWQAGRQDEQIRRADQARWKQVHRDMRQRARLDPRLRRDRRD